MAVELPGAAKWGVGVALVLAALLALAALWIPIPNFAWALVFLAVARGLRRGNPWAGYGGALLIAALTGSLLVSVSRSELGAPSTAQVVIGLALYAIPALLLCMAGRSLSRSERRGRPAVWIVAAAATFVSLVVFRPFIVPTGAMEDTLLIGDQFLLMPASLQTPGRGDIVALRYPVDRRQTFIKRIVAAGGDRVRLQGKKLWINGQEQPEPFVTHKTQHVDMFRDNFPQEPQIRLPNSQWEQELKQHTVNGEFVVPRGKLFVLGDNRDNSLDSRYWGLLAPHDIIGKPALIYFSVEKLEGNSPVLLQPGKIRWSRMFKLL